MYLGLLLVPWMLMYALSTLAIAAITAVAIAVPPQRTGIGE